MNSISIAPIISWVVLLRACVSCVSYPPHIAIKHCARARAPEPRDVTRGTWSSPQARTTTTTVGDVRFKRSGWRRQGRLNRQRLPHTWCCCCGIWWCRRRRQTVGCARWGDLAYARAAKRRVIVHVHAQRQRERKREWQVCKQQVSSIVEFSCRFFSPSTTVQMPHPSPERRPHFSSRPGLTIYNICSLSNYADQSCGCIFISTSLSLW